LPVVTGDPAAAPSTGEVADPVSEVVAAALRCLKIADAILPKMLIRASKISTAHHQE
jgi:hypothetical protein